VYCEYNLIAEDYSIFKENILYNIRISNLEKCEWGSALVHSCVDMNCDCISHNPAVAACTWPISSLVSALYPLPFWIDQLNIFCGALKFQIPYCFPLSLYPTTVILQFV